MKVLRQRQYLFALLALLFVFAGCRGEDPTAPPVGGGSGGSGGITPPVGATLTLTASNPNPLAGSTTTITANVTVNNGPAPNGTAVEFSASGTGRFSDTGQNITIRTTTNGVATATLTSAAAGAVTVTAVVNNVQQQITVTFQSAPITPPTPDLTPVITAVAPNQGRPEGGETVTITGRNFRGPVRVLFDLGNGVQREAIVISQTATQIQVLTPAVDLGAGQTQAASIIVFTEAGTSAETRLTAAFTYRRTTLTPRITTVSPDSGPVTGGTRITIFGDGFEAPVQVSFSTDGATWSAMEVVNVTFNQIIAITPLASAVNPNGSGPLLGPVSIRIININSATEATRTAVFRYTPKVLITAVGPTQGTSLGGTRVQIDGLGFEDPVAVTLGGVGATVVGVSGTRVIAISSPLASPCDDALDGDVSVTNIENGDGDVAEGLWSYIGVDPVIIGVTSTGPIAPGATVAVSVLNPGLGAVRIGAGSSTLIPTPAISTTQLGTGTFSIVLPTTGFTFPTLTCTTASGTPGTQLGPVSVDLSFTNITTGCEDDLTMGLTVQPPAPNTCLAPPTASTIPTAPNCANAGSIVSAGTVTGTTTITVSNAPNSQPLIITNAVGSGTNGTVIVTPTAGTIPAGGSQTFTVTVDPTCTTTPCAVTGTVTFSTNDPQRGSLPVCVTATGT